MAKSAPKKAAAPDSATAPAPTAPNPSAAPNASAAPAKKVTATKAAPVAKKPAEPGAEPVESGDATTAAAKKASTAKAAPTKKAPVAKDAETAAKPAAKPAAKAPEPAEKPPPRDAFDSKFLEAQRKLLLEERAKLLGQAEVLEGEAASLMEDLEPGDVQFDDESGEGDSLVVERERDLALSAQARDMIVQIDAALNRISDGTYGYSLLSGRPIPKERLRAIPWATELVEEKVGGLGRR
jgi:RNA polymerase-binding transcription factor DksA